MGKGVRGLVRPRSGTEGVRILKRKLNYRKFFLLTCVIGTLIMTAIGVEGRLGSNENTDLLQAVINFGFTLFIMIGQRKMEKLDELARRNIGKAALGTVFFCWIVLTVLSVIWSIFNISGKAFILLPSDLSFALGGIELSLGVQFFIFDKWGKA